MNPDIEEQIDWHKEIYGDGYLRIDRERLSKRQVDLWSALEGMSSGVALMPHWEFKFGSAVEVIRPFLELTGERAESFPCPSETPCGCCHTIQETRRGEIVARCRCERDCGTYQLEPGDILFHGLNRERFGRVIRHALGFGEPSAAGYASHGLLEIGTYMPMAAPVYFSMEETGGLLRELTQIVSMRTGPFLVLTPIGSCWSAEVEALARAHAGGHVALSSVLMVDGPWKSNGAIEAMLAEFAKRVASLRDVGSTVRSIHREIAAVRSDFVELRSAKQRLEKMLAEGYLEFTKKVDAASFKLLCTILAEGDIAKASRSLGVPEATVRAAVRRWESGTKEQRTMAELVRWRKKVGRKEKVPLNEAVLQQRAATTDYPGLLSDMLDGLLSMTEENWAAQCEQLSDMLRAALESSGGR